MFTGFTDETVRFFLDLKFHNETAFFHQEHDRYVREVQTPFYELIEDLAPDMQRIDPGMEVRPYKCLSRIHRDTRFSRDKSPYRDHHWLLFRRAAEPREKSLFYFFEFGPQRVAWGMGFWGENRTVMDMFRRRLAANPEGMLGFLDDLEMEKRGLYLDGSFWKKIQIPPQIPDRLKRWYCMRETYIGKMNPDYRLAFTDRLTEELRKDFQTMAPLYQLMRGMMDELPPEERQA